MAEPLLFLPGLFCDARVFATQMTALGRDMSVMIAPTSTHERIEEMASEILSGAPLKFALVGHCLGGAVALEVLRRAPDRVTRIALVGSTPLADTPQDAAIRETQIVSIKAGRLEDVVRETVSRGWFTSGNTKNDGIAKLVAMARANGGDASVRQLRAFQRRKDQQGTSRKIKQPVLVMCGEEDGVTPRKRHEFMAELIPYAKLEVVERAGHLPMLDQPQVTTELLRSFMRQPLVLR